LRLEAYDIPKPTLTVLPQSSLFTGDSVTLRCEVDQSRDGGEFLWSKNSNTESTEAAAKTIDSVKVSDGGVYRCRARRGGYYTDYSEPVTVTIHGKCIFSYNELLLWKQLLKVTAHFYFLQTTEIVISCSQTAAEELEETTLSVLLL
uniref:Ig-like domain-containing protein n=1 Tax=Cyprinus carpio TaxID=7962 RepID=A0A8C2AU56_CYPCA